MASVFRPVRKSRQNEAKLMAGVKISFIEHCIGVARETNVDLTLQLKTLLATCVPARIPRRLTVDTRYGIYMSPLPTHIQSLVPLPITVIRYNVPGE